MPAKPLDEAKIAEAAFHIWVAEGRPDGRADDHWYRARASLEDTVAMTKTAKPRAKTPAKAVKAPAKTAKPKVAKAN